jgi:hypothetical protein
MPQGRRPTPGGEALEGAKSFKKNQTRDQVGKSGLEKRRISMTAAGRRLAVETGVLVAFVLVIVVLALAL